MDHLPSQFFSNQPIDNQNQFDSNTMVRIVKYLHQEDDLEFAEIRRLSDEVNLARDDAESVGYPCFGLYLPPHATREEINMLKEENEKRIAQENALWEANAGKRMIYEKLREDLFMQVKTRIMD